MRRRTDLVWGVVVLVLAAILVLRALQIVPEGVYDIVSRAWPALLVLAGLSVFLRSRITFGAVIALAMSLVLVGGVAAVAFSTRAAQQREDYRQPIEQTLGTGINLLRLQVATLTTDVELFQSLNTGGVITGEFLGSTESTLQIGYAEEGTAATLSVVEQQTSQFPMLENVGRGTLRIELPPDLPLDVELIGTDGTIRLNMSGLAVERMNLNLQQGNVLVTLPLYKPLGSQPDESLGTLAVQNGDISLFIPLEVAARLDLNRSGSGIEPLYDPTVYNYLVGDVLEARTALTSDIVVRYTITAPRGRIRIEVPEEEF